MPSLRTSSLLFVAACAAAASAAACGKGSDTALACDVEPSQEFHDRIEPLLSDTKVSTCNQCHLSGVDLSVFARATPCETWACLNEQGLVDVASPADSKLLSWIDRASPDSDLITPDVIAAEHDAFQDWIEANAACPDACAGVTCGAPGEGPICAPTDQEPPAVPATDEAARCTDRELEQAFYDEVYAWRGRCFPCHFDTQARGDDTAPRWFSAVGNCQTGSAVSLKRIVSLGLFDTDTPENSLLLRKPLDLPELRHGGGAKFTTDDPAYVDFLRFIELYRQCRAP